MIEYQGVKRSLSEWAKIIGVSKQTLHERLKKYPPEIAFRKKLNKGRGSFKQNLNLKPERGLKIPEPKIEGLADILNSIDIKEITDGLFNSEELERIRKCKLKKLQ